MEEMINFGLLSTKDISDPTRNKNFHALTYNIYTKSLQYIIDFVHPINDEVLASVFFCGKISLRRIDRFEEFRICGCGCFPLCPTF